MFHEERVKINFQPSLKFGIIYMLASSLAAYNFSHKYLLKNLFVNLFVFYLYVASSLAIYKFSFYLANYFFTITCEYLITLPL